jgi:hypothetical protein
MILVHVGVPPEHVQVIRSNIEPESVDKSRDVENEPIMKHRDVFLKLKTVSFEI